MGKGGQSGYLILEDGRVFPGRFTNSATITSPSIGEVVFNTAMSGYQEVLYDPSYWGQIVVMTCPHIGNTGVNTADEESREIYLTGFTARSFEEPSNWRSESPLMDLLNRTKTAMFEDLDTRAVTRHLREGGSLRGGIFPDSVSINDAMEMVLEHPEMEGRDGAKEVTCKEPYDWEEGTDTPWIGNTEMYQSDWKAKVAVID